MKNYLPNTPLVESPFFLKLLEKKDLSKEDKDLIINFYENGYTIIDLNLSENELKEIKQEIDYLNDKSDVKTQHEGYHYSKGKRIFEGWKQSEKLRKLSLNEIVLNKLKLFYERNPIPFQTITFNYGSNQPLHSDTIHFHSKPERWLTACWVALEDMDENNGSLVYVPKSHKLPVYDFYDLGIKAPKFNEQIEPYREYEKFIQELVLAHNFETKKLICKKGQALIWAANLLHGGDQIKDTSRSRYSHVTHYYFEGCDKYYSPMFSESWKGEFSEKDLKSKNFNAILDEKNYG